MVAVHHREDRVRRGLKRIEHEREAAARLLVLPGAAEEHGDVDAVHEVRGAASLHGRTVAVHGPTEAGEVEREAPDLLVGGARGIAPVDPGLVPGHPALLGLGVAHREPRSREAGVVGAAGPLLAPEVVEDRQRSDAGQARGPGGGDEQLGVAGVGEPDHADVVVQDPRLAGDGLDHVVAICALGGAEEVEDAAGAARAPDVDPDGGEPQQVGDRGPRGGAVGVGGAVPAVLDHGGPGPGAEQVLVRRADEHRERDAVADPQVAEARLELLVVERGVRMVVDGQHPNRAVAVAGRLVDHGVGPGRG